MYNDLPHPPATYIGEKYAWRCADGSCNNLSDPEMGKAGMPYARSVQQGHPLPQNQLPDAGLVFDTLLKREKVTSSHCTRYGRTLTCWTVRKAPCRFVKYDVLIRRPGHTHVRLLYPSLAYIRLTVYDQRLPDVTRGRQHQRNVFLCRLVSIVWKQPSCTGQGPDAQWPRTPPKRYVRGGSSPIASTGGLRPPRLVQQEPQRE